MNRDYASNAPISRPTNTVENPDRDFGGICFDKKRGLVFKTVTEHLPFKDPVRRANG